MTRGLGALPESWLACGRQRFTYLRSQVSLEYLSCCGGLAGRCVPCGERGQTGCFPYPENLQSLRANESCQTNIRKRSVCPQFPSPVFQFPPVSQHLPSDRLG